MKTITTQKELDALKRIEVGEAIEISSNKILIVNAAIEVLGFLKVSCKLQWNARAELRGNASAVLRENARAVLWGNASAELWGNASAVLWGNASAELWGNASAELRENASAELRGNARAVLYNFSVVWKNIKAKVSITKKSKHAHIVVTQDQNWFERNGIEKTKSLTLYKKVSKDFKTQENTPNETCWSIGSIVKHQDWNPKEQECGGGKFHACSRPYFCDEFRNEIGDRYIAIRVALVDVYVWEDHPSYPYKIGFRQGKVLYECDKFGEKITEDGKIEVKK